MFLTYTIFFTKSYLYVIEIKVFKISIPYMKTLWYFHRKQYIDFSKTCFLITMFVIFKILLKVILVIWLIFGFGYRFQKNNHSEFTTRKYKMQSVILLQKLVLNLWF